MKKATNGPATLEKDGDQIVLTTAANADLPGPTVDRSLASGAINVLLYHFPSAESFPLSGQENISSSLYADIYKMCRSGDLTAGPIITIFRLHRPDAVVADVAFWWMADVARELEVPNIIFYAIRVFPMLAMEAVHRSRMYGEAGQGADTVAVAVVTGREIQMPRSCRGF